MRGVWVANSDLSKYAFGEWQYVQSFPMAFANMPIDSKKLSTGRPLSTVMVLKTSSDTGTFSGALCADPAGPAAPAAPARHVTAMAVAPRNIRLTPNCMMISF